MQSSNIEGCLTRAPPRCTTYLVHDRHACHLPLGFLQAGLAQRILLDHDAVVKRHLLGHAAPRQVLGDTEGSRRSAELNQKTWQTERIACLFRAFQLLPPMVVTLIHDELQEKD